MNEQIQTLLCHIAHEHAGELKFAPGSTIRLYAWHDSETPIAEVNPEQPQSELIYRILYLIGLKLFRTGKPYKIHVPFFINRPYENEYLGEMSYQARRKIRLFCGPRWRASVWALLVYSQIGCRNDLKDFLNRHPEKVYIMCFVIPAVWKERLTRGFKNLLFSFKAKTPTT